MAGCTVDQGIVFLANRNNGQDGTAWKGGRSAGKQRWAMEASQVDLFYQSYIRRSFQHQLNLHRWFVEDPGCALCSNASHPHRVPNQCHPRALYSTWHHTQFLKDLASTHGGQTSCHQLLTTTTINPATGKLPLSVRGGYGNQELLHTI